METVVIYKYKCSTCGEQFDSQDECRRHEEQEHQTKACTIMLEFMSDDAVEIRAHRYTGSYDLEPFLHPVYPVINSERGTNCWAMCVSDITNRRQVENAIQLLMCNAGHVLGEYTEKLRSFIDQSAARMLLMEQIDIRKAADSLQNDKSYNIKRSCE